MVSTLGNVAPCFLDKARGIIEQHKKGEVTFKKLSCTRSLFSYKLGRGERLVYFKGSYLLMRHSEYEKFINKNRRVKRC